MKACFVLALAAAAVVCTAGTPVDRQQAVLQLLFKPTEPIRDRFTDLKSAAASFDPTADKSQYSDGGAAAAHLMEEINDHRVLEQHHWFSLFNTRQREEALMLFDVLMSCNSWDCFKNNAAFFREKMNEGEFIYAIYVAVIHSPLTDGVALPPLYEVTPHLFTNTEVIQQAYTAKMTQTPGNFEMGYTGSQKNPEQRVAYFGEDVGMNSHHTHWHMDFPFWWEDKYGHHIDRKGELFFWMHHQLTVRFDAERLSNNLDIVDELYWDKPIYRGFAPHTTYRHGGEFPSRPDNIDFEDVDGVARVRDMKIMENRIRDAIAHGYIENDHDEHISLNNTHGIDILGDLIESSVYSPNAQYYGALHNLAHIMLGRQADPHGKYKMPPGVMEHFETATRDPSFFRLHKYMDNIFKEHKDSLPAYSSDELGFDGVSLDSVAIDGTLETYFEHFKFDLTMAVDDTPEIADVELTADVSRLNHKSFAYNFQLTNNKGSPASAVFRVFLCPRKDYNGILIPLEERRWLCIEMDKFWKTLSPGGNTVVRKSGESSVTIPDRKHFAEMMSETDAAASSGGSLDYSDLAHSCGQPERLLLPKGKVEGMEFGLLIAVTDGEHDAAVSGLEDNEHGSNHGYCGIHNELYPDKQPMGFPLDRKIEDRNMFVGMPNINYNIVNVFHKE
uniref:Hemocyanin n=1 Tax=Nebalia kensleyi TaxID=586406 RepID=C8BP49_9CRUS|nr:hemocyanin [Nebalia kensleyi]